MILLCPSSGPHTPHLLQLEKEQSQDTTQDIASFFKPHEDEAEKNRQQLETIYKQDDDISSVSKQNTKLDSK